MCTELVCQKPRLTRIMLIWISAVHTLYNEAELTRVHVNALVG